MRSAAILRLPEGAQPFSSGDGAKLERAPPGTRPERRHADRSTTYTLADADVAGPFQAIPEEMMDKAKLPALGYASARRGAGREIPRQPEPAQSASIPARTWRAPAS
jgi:hypothetical protein